ncbi:Uu.00g037790.m01.CDS01 [Anthostomella pinea]|uniref:Uu.00g037790.m01.CDS01 n=1 Tax=Anthostomella pinea TaxID=933095 RepID=A0AAI8YDK9_9PEZI|nr:Uu.00g037790.m01.CDS01 [Anthostomella pinea]
MVQRGNPQDLLQLIRVRHGDVVPHAIIQAKLKSVAVANPELADSVEAILAYEYKKRSTGDDVVQAKLKSVAVANPELADSVEAILAY